jgi:hypothetical protein
MMESIDMIGFGTEGFMLTAEEIAESFDGERHIHNNLSMTGGWDRSCRRQKRWMNEPAVRISKTGLLNMKHLRGFLGLGYGGFNKRTGSRLFNQLLLIMKKLRLLDLTKGEIGSTNRQSLNKS